MDSYFGWGTVEDGWRKGPWTPQEDKILTEHVNLHGEGRWNSISMLTGLRRSGKSCRLRWVNYLRPDLKRGKITPNEESIIVELHARWGNRWSTIARSLPGRTDNEIKNYWRTHFKKSKTTKNIGRARARFLRQQQEQNKQQQSQDLQYQQQQQQIINELAEMKACIAQDMQEIASCGYCSMMPQQAQDNPSAGAGEAEASADEGAWGSLWNLDDMRAGSDYAAVTPPDGFVPLDQLFSLLY